MSKKQNQNLVPPIDEDDIIWEEHGVDIRTIQADEVQDVAEYVRDALRKIDEGIFALIRPPKHIEEYIYANDLHTNILSDRNEVMHAIEEQVSNVVYWEQALDAVLDYGTEVYSSGGQGEEVKRQALS